MSIKIFRNYIPCKKYGQNFLLNKKTIKHIVNLINPKRKQILVEIGPGLGALTEPVCQLLEELIIIEIDQNLLNLLRKYSFYSKLIVVCKNALTVNFTSFSDKKRQSIRIFGNLPYNISTSLIIYLFKQIEVIQDMNFMLQKEVAERLVAIPGNKSYGRLSIIAQYYCNIKILLNVSPDDFRPVPKVKSMFVNLTPHTTPPYFAYDITLLSYITKIAFQNRRKILRHSLKNLFSENILIQLGIDPRLRAENISILQYCTLANYIARKIE